MVGVRGSSDMGELYIGVMSGTSLDGIDVALCKIDENSCKILFSCEYNFDEGLKRDILNLINNHVTLKEIGEIDTKLGYMYARVINEFLDQNKISKDDIKAIGLHGQTLWHSPNSSYPFSMQLGNASVVNIQTGICVVSDFRQKDIALGGEGAPLSPAFHKFVFSQLKLKTAVLNIGGMANITILGERLVGYDTGCGNVLMDLWVQKCKNIPYDKDGEFAKSGEVDASLLDCMLSESYFSKAYPKSTGRELFNEKWLDKKLKKFKHLKDEDIQATLLELTVKSIANEIKKTDIELLLVCGGGAKNKLLMDRLSFVLENVKVATTNDYGVDADFMEAMAFAYFAYKRLKKQTIELSCLTGAKEDTILGAIYE